MQTLDIPVKKLFHPIPLESAVNYNSGNDARSERWLFSDTKYININMVRKLKLPLCRNSITNFYD